MKDTEEQLLAESFDRHLAVTANAGSGKTRVLVQRYVDILISSINQDKGRENDYVGTKNIVAITFTRKAAAEMLSKIVIRIEEELSKPDNTGTRLQKLRKIREGLTYANISTIHSFCSSLLRDYPIEADVPHNFIELSEAELHQIKRDSVLKVMEDWLDENEPDKRSKSMKLYTTFGRESVEQFLMILINKVEIFKSLYNFYLKSDEEILLSVNIYFKEKILPSIKTAINQLYNLFSNIDSGLFSKKESQEYYQAFSNLENINEITNSLNDTYSVEHDDFINTVASLKDIFYTKSGTLRKTLEKGLTDLPKPEVFDRIFRQLELSSEISQSLSYKAYHSELLSLSRIMFCMAGDVLDAIELEKQDLSGLDFDDMLLKTLKLLDNEDVCNKLIYNIKYLLIDEFQDTNDIQYEIVKKIVPELSSPSANPPGINLYIVGDAKQSIYGFRNADVRVFEKACFDIRNVNKYKMDNGKLDYEIKTSDGNKKPKVNNEPFGEIMLTATFRLQPAIASFVNKVCGNIMNRKESEYDVGYADFICSRNVKDFKGDIYENDGDVTGISKYGSVSLLLNIIEKEDREEKESIDEVTIDTGIKDEAERVALLIKNIVEGETNFLLFNDEGNQIKPRYSDFAVLARKKNGLSRVADSFIRNNIPVIVHSGSGFYESQEVIDIISLLNFLNNQKDNISFIGLLRSPFFNISDTSLFQISAEKNCSSFYEKFQQFSLRLIKQIDNGIDDTDSIKDNYQTKNNLSNDLNNCIRSYNILVDLITIAPVISISQLLIKVLTQCGWYGTIAANPGRYQQEANIEKLIQYARDFENKGFRNLYDFVAELNFISNASINEAEAVIITGDNVVNVMTVHASKGLEFPIVILYDTNSRMPHSDNLNVSKELGISFQLPVTSDEGYTTLLQTPINLIQSRMKELSSLAEEKRILYVAMTRAKDHLIISGSLKRNKDGKLSKPASMLGLIFEGMEITPDDMYFNGQAIFRDKLKILYDLEPKQIIFEYSVKLIPEFTNNLNIGIAEEFNYEFPMILLAHATGSISEDIYSASKIMSFNKNKEEYLRKYMLGLPSEDGYALINKIRPDGEVQDDIVGSFAGTMIHKILESIKSWFNKTGNIDVDKLGSIIDTETDRIEIAVKPVLKQRILRECINIASSPLLQNNAGSLESAKPEYSLTMPLGDDFLTAKIDLLIQNNDGNWEIWDWKTNRVDNNSINQLTENYKFQLQVYLYFLKLLFPEQEKFTARLLYTRLASYDAIDEYWTRKLEISSRELEEFGKQLESKIKEIKEFVL